jgi:3-oxoacyl-[acyl-carrier protein] reductase
MSTPPDRVTPQELSSRDHTAPLALITGAARVNSLAAGIALRLKADGWGVATSDVAAADYPCDLSAPDGPQTLMDGVN